MSRMNRFLYSLADGLKGILRNLMMSLMSFSMLIGSLLVVGSLSLLVVNIDAIIQDLGDQNEIMVYVHEEYDDSEFNQISQAIMEAEHVVGFTFVSRETALEEMKNDLEEYASILEGMEQDNPLRDGFRIQVDDPANVEAVVTAMEGVDGIGNVEARTDVVESFLKTRNAVNLISIGLMVLLAGISTFIIMNTIKMSAYTRREEIAIMRMVGATKGTIRLSFVTEAMIICLCGSIVSFFAIMFLYQELIEKAFSSTGLLQAVPFQEVWGGVLLIFVGASLVIGVLGSLLSINKYLKV
ncbi:MAG: permease-like cell division protein FtsX [Clostridia bacterium]|nr:permease-like cell division protein FtsX [Clostridia bacterium]